MTDEPWGEAVERHRVWRASHPDAAGSIEPLAEDERAELADWLDEELPEGTLLWGDDQSNYAGVYIDGPLLGMVFVLMHDEQNLAPRFATADRFVDRLLVDDSDVLDLGMLVSGDACELPPDSLTSGELGSRLAVALDLLGQTDHTDDEASIQAVRTALALVPHTPVPAELLDAFVAVLDFHGLYAWQDIPRLLAEQNYRGRGAPLRQALELGRNEPSFDARRALVRAALA